MKALQAFSSFWNRFWFTPRDARPIAIMRMAVGFVIVLQMSERFGVARIGYSNEGYLRKEALEMFLSGSQLSVYQLFDDPWHVKLGLALTMAGAACFAAGIWTRAAGTLAFVLLVSLHHRNPIVMYGADVLPKYFLFYLLLARSDAAFSVASWRRRLAVARDKARQGRDARAELARAPTIPGWPVRLFQIQVFFIYLFTGINKNYGTDYHAGTALWYALANPTFSRFYPEALPLYSAVFPVLQALTIATLYWELAFPWMILFRRLRPIALSMGVVVHGGIATVMKIGWWGQLMLVSYLSFISGRPFRWLRLRYVREKRAQVPRAERLCIHYDPHDAAAAELAARVAVADGARLVRLSPGPGELHFTLGSRAVGSADALKRLRMCLSPWMRPAVPARLVTGGASADASGE